MGELKVGDMAWIGTFENRESTIPCPICAGKLNVTLILGNGDSVILPCDYCGKGYGEPRGVIREYERIPRADVVVIDEVKVTKNSNGTKVEYATTNHSVFAEEELFASREKAIAYAHTLADEQMRKESTRAEYIKKDTNKTYSWNAGYHLCKAKQSHEQAEYHTRMAILCKAKAKIDD